MAEREARMRKQRRVLTPRAGAKLMQKLSEGYKPETKYKGRPMSSLPRGEHPPPGFNLTPTSRLPKNDGANYQVNEGDMDTPAYELRDDEEEFQDDDDTEIQSEDEADGEEEDEDDEESDGQSAAESDATPSFPSRFKPLPPISKPSKPSDDLDLQSVSDGDFRTASSGAQSKSKTPNQTPKVSPQRTPSLSADEEPEEEEYNPFEDQQEPIPFGTFEDYEKLMESQTKGELDTEDLDQFDTPLSDYISRSMLYCFVVTPFKVNSDVAYAAIPVTDPMITSLIVSCMHRISKHARIYPLPYLSSARHYVFLMNCTGDEHLLIRATLLRAFKPTATLPRRLYTVTSCSLQNYMSPYYQMDLDDVPYAKRAEYSDFEDQYTTFINKFRAISYVPCDALLNTSIHSSRGAAFDELGNYPFGRLTYARKSTSGKLIADSHTWTTNLQNCLKSSTNPVLDDVEFIKLIAQDSVLTKIFFASGSAMKILPENQIIVLTPEIFLPEAGNSKFIVQLKVLSIAAIVTAIAKAERLEHTQQIARAAGFPYHNLVKAMDDGLSNSIDKRTGELLYNTYSYKLSYEPIHF